MRRIIILWIALPLLSIMLILTSGRWYLTQSPEDVTLVNGVHLKWSPCWFNVPWNKIIHCGHLSPSLQNTNSSISLPVVVFKNISLSFNSDPVLFINGGPGDANVLNHDGIRDWSDYIDGLNWARDFIVMDHRGTGLSQPKPECKALYDYYEKSLVTKVGFKQEVRRDYVNFERCLKQVNEQHDLANYSTFHSTQDIRDLMNTMDYSSWNLFGVSYGTRVALELMRAQPDNVRSVILDSVYPTDKHSLLKWPSLQDNAVEMVFERCKKTKACDEEYPELRKLLTEALLELKDKPRKVNVYNYYNDRYYDAYINDQRFLTAIYISMYNEQLLPHIPAAIYGAAYEDSALMEPIISAFADYMLDKDFNDVVFFSVECNDSKRISEPQYQKEISKYPYLKKYHRYDWQYNTCRNWTSDAEKILPVAHVKSNIPTLVLSGEYDPVTPWQWGKEVHNYLLNSYYFKYADMGHSVLTANNCAVKNSRDFLNNPNEQPVSCN